MKLGEGAFSSDAWNKSPPARGAWIEIIVALPYRLNVLSPPARGAWIEILNVGGVEVYPWSPPARGAWIEIMLTPACSPA